MVTGSTCDDGFAVYYIIYLTWLYGLQSKHGLPQLLDSDQIPIEVHFDGDHAGQATLLTQLGKLYYPPTCPVDDYTR